ncbi:threonine/serine exporter family protein [Oceanobacillus alkalisoli]|uniref:threonine/serine exporter family protein n=1 Tax=Oceanobacillus alkalisoli TaxID=2925113 RepID=UPI003F68B8EE|nr:threonine/serine exporter family protein [Oceanobacillus alkalisoli]
MVLVIGSRDEARVEKVCMIAGKIMLMSGAETHRVEDTMNRMAHAFGVENAQSHATPTGINFSAGMTEVNNFVRISKRPTDLHKIAEVNSISRKIVAGELSLETAYDHLQKVEAEPSVYKVWLQILIAALVSGCFVIMFQGTWIDFLPAFIAGGLGFAVMTGMDRLLEIRYLAEFFGAFVIGVSAYLFIYYGFGLELDKVIIGAVMPLVPGLHITNAIRDMVAGHLLSGISKGVEATLTAFSIGAGISLIFAFI